MALVLKWHLFQQLHDIPLVYLQNSCVFRLSGAVKQLKNFLKADSFMSTTQSDYKTFEMM